MATTIDTLANVKTRLLVPDATDDTLLTALMETADYQIRRFVGGRTFPAVAASGIIEYHDGNRLFLQVSRPPIDSVTSIKVDAAYGWGSGVAALTANTDYVIRSSSAGIIQSLTGHWYPGPAGASLKALDQLPQWYDYPGVVKLTYVGDGPAPDDVKQAFALLILHHYQIAKREAATAFKRLAFLSDGTNQYQRHDEADSLPGMPAIVRALLAPYKVHP